MHRARGTSRAHGVLHKKDRPKAVECYYMNQKSLPRHVVCRIADALDQFVIIPFAIDLCKSKFALDIVPIAVLILEINLDFDYNSLLDIVL